MSRHTIKGSRWDRVAAHVKDRDGWACVACGSGEDLTVDHVKPVSTHDDDDIEAGRAYDPDELVTLCRPCNSRKGTRATLRVNYFNRRFFPAGPPETSGTRVFHTKAPENLLESFSVPDGDE